MSDPFDRTFRDRTLAGERLFGLFLDLGSAAAADVCAAVGYDWLYLRGRPSLVGSAGSGVDEPRPGDTAAS